MGSTVEDEVMDIHQQIDMLGSHDDFKAIEYIVGKVEGAHELVFVSGQRLLAHLSDGHLHRMLRVQMLHEACLVLTETNGQLRMFPDECLQGISQRVGVSRRREGYLHRDVVERCRRILQTVEIYSRLRVAQRISGNG